MRGLTALLVLVIFTVGCTVRSSPATPAWAIALHGGAGVIERASMTPQREAEYRTALSADLEIGAKILREGGSALDAVESIIRVMEDDPLFNAGRGAVFTAAGRNELDAAIMDGATLRAGSVAGVTRTRHPISLARTVMEKSPHVMLAGEGADAFAREQGLEMVSPAFFFTERRWQELEDTLKRNGDPVPPRPAGVPQPRGEITPRQTDEHKWGTVGVVALDTHRSVAAGTSTGGTTAKKWGRIGDSPIIGAGTYASNQSCAVSGTGAGEFFIRLTIAREICALVQYKNYDVQRASDELVQQRLAELKGTGGVIAISPKGEIAWSFNTPGMYRAKVSAGSMAKVAIFKDEP